MDIQDDTVQYEVIVTTTWGTPSTVSYLVLADTEDDALTVVSGWMSGPWSVKRITQVLGWQGEWPHNAIPEG